MIDEKTFTQEQLDEIVKDRVARLKRQHDEEIKETADALKATQAELQTLRKAETDAALAEIALLKEQVDPALHYLAGLQYGFDRNLGEGLGIWPTGHDPLV